MCSRLRLYLCKLTVAYVAIWAAFVSASWASDQPPVPLKLAQSSRGQASVPTCSNTPTDTEVDSALILEWLARADECEKGNGVELNRLQGIELYLMAANQGHSDSQRYRLGALLGQ